MLAIHYGHININIFKLPIATFNGATRQGYHAKPQPILPAL